MHSSLLEDKGREFQKYRYMYDTYIRIVELHNMWVENAFEEYRTLRLWDVK